MQTKTSFRSKVFKNAYKIWGNFKHITFSEALRTAWVVYRAEKERAKHIVKKAVSTDQLEKIARNINAFDTLYHYIDGYNNQRKYDFWCNLQKRLESIIETLTDTAKEQLKTLCEPQQAQYFGIY